ncbi:MAG: acylphosphatase [Chitinophagales bacterium]|nr:acylphosphatase [Chitinophagales bacterium]
MNALNHYSIKVHGKVQGVFFRASARSQAEELGIKGTVKNEQDGSVFIEAEGDSESLRIFLEWCHKGPDRARVDKVEAEEGPLQNFSEFKVTRS